MQDACPPEFWYVPQGHVVHELAPAFEYVPGLQSVQEGTPPDERLPAGHVRQLDCPELGWYWPVAQSEQLDAPPVE